MYFVEKIHPPFEWWWIPCSNLGFRNPFGKDPTVRNATFVTRFTGRQVVSLCLYIVFWLWNHMNFGFKPIVKDSLFQRKENTLNLRTPPPSSSLLWDCCSIDSSRYPKKNNSSQGGRVFFRASWGEKKSVAPTPRGSKFHLVKHHPNHPNPPASLGIRRNVLRNSTQ